CVPFSSSFQHSFFSPVTGQYTISLPANPLVSTHFRVDVADEIACTFCFLQEICIHTRNTKIMSSTRDKKTQPGPTDSIIMSRNNPTIKQFRALLKRPERERTGHALIEGLRLVTEALQFPDLVRQIVVAPELLKSQRGRDLVRSHAARGF